MGGTRPTHFLRPMILDPLTSTVSNSAHLSVHFSERRQSNPFHLSNYGINFEPIKMNVTFQETNENIN